MRYETIADVFSANQKIHERLVEVLHGLTDNVAAATTDGEQWSVKQIVEHIALVDNGMSMICGKLLAQAMAAGIANDGRLELSADFIDNMSKISEMKFEPPERVVPTGEVSIEESLDLMKTAAQAFDTMGPDLASFDVTQHKFPHPYFGPLSATEWLVLLGGHKARHTQQIERLLEKIT